MDKDLFEGQPKILSRLASVMASLLPADTELLAGLELGGRFHVNANPMRSRLG